MRSPAWQAALWAERVVLGLHIWCRDAFIVTLTWLLWGWVIAAVVIAGIFAFNALLSFAPRHLERWYRRYL
jgi:hypothetical protein